MLSPYRVLDLTDDRGELCSMILGDLGADVVKIEPPQGSTSRRKPPLLLSGPVEERSLQYYAFNRNKRSVMLDLDTAAGRDHFLSLVRSADFLIESANPGYMTSLGLGFESLSSINPTLVHVAITAFGQDGPYADFPASDLTIAALSGPVFLQGVPERPPVRISVPQAWLHASAEAAVGTLVAHRRMQQTGEAQFVDVSAQAAMVWTMLNAPVAHAVQGHDFVRLGSAPSGVPRIFDCADGQVLVATFSTRQTALGVLRWLVADGVVPASWLTDEDWPTYGIRVVQGQPVAHTLEEFLSALRRFLGKRTQEDLLLLGLADRVSIVPVNNVEALVRFPHLRARSYWHDALLPDGSRVRAPGPFIRLQNKPSVIGLEPPRLGEHSEEVIAELCAVQQAPDPRAKKPAGQSEDLPFAGLKVADFSWVGVGPITAKYLADHGAQVVHVETESPADVLRTNAPFKDGVPGINRSQFFGDFNTSKQSLSLDLKNPAGVEIARRLIAWADVYIESFTPGTVDELGIGYKTARELNPSIVMASTCLMGQTGPTAKLAGFGFHAAAVAGFFEVTGWPDLPPDGPWVAYTDTIAPRFLSATLIAALDHRRRTGLGEFIDCAQLEAALHFLSPQILDFLATGRMTGRQGNRDISLAPHGVYRCAGDDQWCAIAVETDTQWQALCRLLDLGTVKHLNNAEDRIAHEDEIDALLSAWTADKTPNEVMTTLVRAGVPAGKVQRSSDLLADPQLAHRHFFRYLEHGEMGLTPYSGHQFRIRGYDSGPRFAAPLLGEHNVAVLRDVIGMSDDEVGEALASGAIC